MKSAVCRKANCDLSVNGRKARVRVGGVDAEQVSPTPPDKKHTLCGTLRKEGATKYDSCIKIKQLIPLSGIAIGYAVFCYTPFQSV